MATEPALKLPQWLSDRPKHLAWRIAERFQAFDRTLDADDEFVAIADLRAAWQAHQEGRLAALTLAIHRLRRAVDKVLKTARLGEYEGQTKNDHELIDAARDLLALTAEEKAVAPAEEEI